MQSATEIFLPAAASNMRGRRRESRGRRRRVAERVYHFNGIVGAEGEARRIFEWNYRVGALDAVGADAGFLFFGTAHVGGLMRWLNGAMDLHAAKRGMSERATLARVRCERDGRAAVGFGNWLPNGRARTRLARSPMAWMLSWKPGLVALDGEKLLIFRIHRADSDVLDSRKRAREGRQ